MPESNPTRGARSDSPVWSHRIGSCQVAAFRRTGKNGPFCVFQFSRLYPSGNGWARTDTFNTTDLECMRLLATHALRFARKWRGE